MEYAEEDMEYAENTQGTATVHTAHLAYIPHLGEMECKNMRVPAWGHETTSVLTRSVPFMLTFLS